MEWQTLDKLYHKISIRIGSRHCNALIYDFEIVDLRKTFLQLKQLLAIRNFTGLRENRVEQ
jgi:hypothetical protein